MSSAASPAPALPPALAAIDPAIVEYTNALFARLLVQVTGPNATAAPAYRPVNFMNAPEKFAGKYEEYATFRHNITVYIDNHPGISRAEPERSRQAIACCCSFMSEGDTATWVRNWHDSEQFRLQTAGTVAKTWMEFLADLDATFKDPYERQKARERLSKLAQGKSTAAEFFVKFDTLRYQAELTDAAHDAILVDMLDKALAPLLVGMVKMNLVTNPTYDQYKTQALRVGPSIGPLADALVAQSRPHRPAPSYPTAPVITRSAPSAPAPAASRPRDPDAMDVDASRVKPSPKGPCYTCGGPHIRLNCPVHKTLKQQKGSAVVRSLIDAGVISEMDVRSFSLSPAPEPDFPNPQ